MIYCPHCNQAFELVQPIPGYARLSKRRREVVDCLLLKPGTFFATEAIANYVYADDADTLPATAITTIRTMIHAINKLLGYKAIRNVYGDGYTIDLDVLNKPDKDETATPTEKIQCQSLE